MLGGNYPHYLALVATRAPAAEVGRVVGDIQAAGQIGGTIGPLVGGLVASQLGLGASFLLSGAISLTALSIAFVGIRPDDPRPPGQTRTRGSLRQALAEPAQRRLMLLFVLGDAGIQGIRPLIPVVIAARLSDPAAVATTTGLTATLSTAGTVVAALLVGRLSQRVAPSSILAATLPSAAVVAALIPFAHSLPALFVLWALLGLAAGATAPAMFAWLSRLAPSGSGAYALLATVNMLSFAIGPALMGQASVYGLDWPFRLAGAAALLAGVLILADRLRMTSVKGF
jgi:MFS family permease